MDESQQHTPVTDIATMRMAEAVVEKTWTIPGYEGKGPVTMTLRLPELTVTDSDGRHIVVSPRQSEIMASRLGGIADWLAHGDGDWLEDD